MAYGFEIYDAKGTIDDSVIGITLIGTDSISGEGNFIYTFPLENPVDYLYITQFEITDAPTSDTIEPEWHLNNVYTGTLDTPQTITNTSGVCLIGGDYNGSYTTESSCNSAGGVWDTTTPYFAVFMGNVAYSHVGKQEVDGCLSSGNSYTNLKANTDLTLYFYAVGLI